MRNRLFFLLILVCAGMMSACNRQPEPEHGVSRELSARRKAQVKNLHYQLRFSIPEDKSQPVEGEVKILFSQENASGITLDFREKAENIREVLLNDRQIDARIINEHILVPGAQGENKIEIKFVAGDQSLNRNDEYLYTLLVPDRARTLFPCFDQPDLKARFTLELDLPESWVAVANGVVESETINESNKKIVFQPTEPLSTYLFSFVAGKWSHLQETRDGRTLTLYHRETDPDKLAQTGMIFDQVAEALRWMEEYTGIPYPFAKYDLVVVPGFQFGGMEHAGAVLYNDKRMFLSEHPTISEELGRMELISHETAHMWFGDYVTMEWFDDVWTKEVFANYFAAQMCEPRFPEVNHRLNTLRSFFPAAYSEDRTLGTNAIRQPLENLNDAGLIYGQIVYNKAPVVMGKLVELMGTDNFRKGLREYLHTYAYANATWDGLIGILDRYTPLDLKTWSRVWVDEKGMPGISAGWSEGELTVRQQDRWGRGLVWVQDIGMQLMTLKPGTDSCTMERIQIRLDDSVTKMKIAAKPDFILPDYDGKAYGHFILDTKTAQYGLAHWSEIDDPVLRLSLIITLYENCLNGGIQPGDFTRSLLQPLEKEKEPLVVSAAIAYIRDICLRKQMGKKTETEQGLLKSAFSPGKIERQLLAFRSLLDVWTLPEISGEIWRIWNRQQLYEGLPLSERDFMKMAYELALRMPEKYDEIVEKQLEHIENQDRKKEFEYIARAVHPDMAVRDSLFDAMLVAGNRRMEPWVEQVIYYLNHPLREQQAVKYILPALEELQEVQGTGDIFFPKNWVSSLLRGHNSPEAARIVSGFLQEHPDYPSLLKNKIIQSADHLLR